MTDAASLALVAAAFVIAGAVKGVIGLGLPTVSLALLTATLGLHPAMALLLVPSLVTNVWQGAVGGHGRAIVARLWPFLACATVPVGIGGLALRAVDVAWLSALLGALLVVYAGTSLGGLRISVPEKSETPLGVLFGGVTGVLTGMTGSFVVPGVLYLQALGMPRDMFIQAMGIAFTLSTAALAVALGANDLLTAELGAVSAAGIVPALAGMVIGQKLRRRLSEEKFRRVFFSALLVMGVYIVARALG